MVFVVEKQTMKFLPTKQCHIVPGVWFRVPRPRKFFHKLAKNSLLTKILPPKDTHYTVCDALLQISTHMMRVLDIQQNSWLHIHVLYTVQVQVLA